MIPNIVEGGDTAGLLRYLVGPGRANEHENPHVVAGSRDVVRRWGDWESLSVAQGGEIATRLDSYMNETGTRPRGKARAFNPATGRVEWNGSPQATHVWHCSLSLSPDEAPLDDATWARIAADFMDDMGFTEASGKAPCKWVAIHHGAAKNGGDHIHIAANTVREDGTKWSPWYDQRRAHRACNALEHRYHLAVVESRENQRGSRCDSADAQRAAARAGAELTDRAALEERLRAAAVAADSEADFVRRARALGVRMHPRFARGRDDVVVGYSAALRTVDGQRPRWWGGGRIARDLALTHLRARWADAPEAAESAVAAWKGEYRPRPPADFPSWEERRRALEVFRDALGRVDPTDRAALARAAADVAGLLGAQALTATGPDRRMLRAAATQVGRAAQLKSAPVGKRPAGAAVRACADLALALAAASDPRAAALALMSAAAGLIRSVADLHAAVGQVRTARAIERDAMAVFARAHRAPGAPVHGAAPVSAYERLAGAPAPVQASAPPPPPLPRAQEPDSPTARAAARITRVGASDPDLASVRMVVAATRRAAKPGARARAGAHGPTIVPAPSARGERGAPAPDRESAAGRA